MTSYQTFRPWFFELILMPNIVYPYNAWTSKILKVQRLTFLWKDELPGCSRFIGPGMPTAYGVAKLRQRPPPQIRVAEQLAGIPAYPGAVGDEYKLRKIIKPVVTRWNSFLTAMSALLVCELQSISMLQITLPASRTTTP
jgi:hypothetical protein